VKRTVFRDFSAVVTTLADDECDVTVSTGVKARDGDIWVTAGADLAQYRRNPVVLFAHDPTRPVGNASSIRIAGDALLARVKFAPAGASVTADEVRGLVKGGVIRAVSAGIIVNAYEPINPNRPANGLRITSWELLEFSFVSVPANPDALVTARHLRSGAAPQAVEAYPLFALAARLNEPMTEERARRIIADARRIGRTPEFHLRWLAAARGAAFGSSDIEDRARRARIAEELAEK
jgi:HK97 family phage prohead protease